MKQLVIVAALLCLSAPSAVAADSFDVRHPIIWKVSKPLRVVSYPVRHPLKTGKWMEESGFNGGLCGAGAVGQILYATRSFWIH